MRRNSRTVWRWKAPGSRILVPFLAKHNVEPFVKAEGSKFCALSITLGHFGKRIVILHVFSDPLAAGHDVEPPVRGIQV